MVLTEPELRRRLVRLESATPALSADEQLIEIERLREQASPPLASALDARLTIAEAMAVAELGREAESIQILEQVCGRSDSGEDEPTLKAVAYALVVRIEMLAAAGRIAEAQSDALQLTAIFRVLTRGTPRRAQVGLMMIDAAFFMLATESHKTLRTVIAALAESDDSQNQDERRLAAAAVLYEMLSQAHAGELAQISAYVKRFGRYSSDALPVLDQVQRNFGKPETNPTFHGVIEMTRAALLERLGHRDQAIDALKRADDTYLAAGLASGHELVAAMQKSWE